MPDDGYDGLSSVEVDAIPSTYVGSGITQRSSSDVTASGPTVTVPGGYYPSGVERTISSTTHPDPSVLINSTTGVVTASHTQSAGYVTAGTTSDTLELSTQGAATITPTESEQTAVAAGKYTTGTVKVGAISSTYVGSEVTRRTSADLTRSTYTINVPVGYYEEPASKTVERITHATPQVSIDSSTGVITATHTQAQGWVEGSGTGTDSTSKTLQLTTQAAKTVTPSEQSQQAVAAGVYTTGAITVAPIPDEYIIPDGTITITQNGTYDVTEKAEASVNVSASLVQRDVANTTGTTREITGDVATIVPLNVTENGTYNAPTGVTGYNPVKVSVSDGQKALNFIDYDGTIVGSYTVEEAQALTALPNNPSHTGLVSQGWNWSLANIKSYLTKYPDGIVNVGQMYKTASGKAEIDVTFDDSECLSPYLAICPNGTCTIDWGDGSATETVSGTSYASLKYLPHTYARTGSYTITIDGNVGFYNSGNSNASLLSVKSQMTNKRTYSRCITAIRLSETSKLGVNTFCYLITMEYITIPNNVTTIGSQAFYNCHGLKSITIPDSITTIEGSVFYNCDALRFISIPDKVTNIKNSVFTSCYNLQNITIPDMVTSIGSSAFSSCYALQSITIPDGVTSIGTNAFGDCPGLKSITIPDNVTSIGSSVFSYSRTLTSIKIPDNVVSIGSSAFYNCISLQTISIPNGVTSIGNSAFYSSGITSITIPNGVTSIGDEMFRNCYSLTSITIPDSVTTIGANVFYSCSSLSSMIIPNSVTSIGNGAFQYCNSILKYHFTSITPPTLGTTAFQGITTDSVIYVPQGSLEAYQTAENWSTYASYMKEEES